MTLLKGSLTWYIEYLLDCNVLLEICPKLHRVLCSFTKTLFITVKNRIHLSKLWFLYQREYFYIKNYGFEKCMGMRRCQQQIVFYNEHLPFIIKKQKVEK